MEWNEIVESIQNVIAQIREKYIINNVTIRDDIFAILEKYCTVLYYPIENERNCGFHIKRIVGEELKDFVYINTAKPLELQTFTAAHELGHIWDVAEMVKEDVGFQETLDLTLQENIINRFAAEILMPYDVFRRTFLEHKLELGLMQPSVSLEDLVKIITMQMSDYLVPYDAVRKRLYETNIINGSTRNYLKTHHQQIEELIALYSKNQNSRLERETMVKSVCDLRNLVEKAEKENTNEILLKKIKQDFDLETTIELEHADEIISIQIGENGGVNGKEGSNC